jgi:hypothetical protein
MVAGKDIVVENSVFSYTTGDEPGSAVNLETGDAGVFSAEAIQNITFRNCIMEKSTLGLTANNHSSSYWHDILFDGCVFRNNRFGGAATGGAALPQNNFRFVNCISENNLDGPGFYSGGSVGIQLIGCRSEGNLGGHGFEFYEPKDFVLRDCSGYNNDGMGVYIRRMQTCRCTASLRVAAFSTTMTEGSQCRAASLQGHRSSVSTSPTVARQPWSVGPSSVGRGPKRPARCQGFERREDLQMHHGRHVRSRCVAFRRTIGQLHQRAVGDRRHVGRDRIYYQPD